MTRKIDAINEKLEADIPLSLDELKYYRSTIRRSRTNLKKSLKFLDEADTYGAMKSSSEIQLAVATNREKVELAIEILNNIDQGVSDNIELLERNDD